jgi:hypothetical protein
MRFLGWRQLALLAAVLALVVIELTAPRHPDAPAPPPPRFAAAPHLHLATATTAQERAQLRELVEAVRAAIGEAAPVFRADEPTLFVYFSDAAERLLCDQSDAAEPVIARVFASGRHIERARLVILRDQQPTPAQVATGLLRAIGVESREDPASPTLTRADIAALQRLYPPAR